jgi:predicted MFS family arabinose efflux permease
MTTLARTAPSRETGGGTTSGRIISRPLLVVFLFEFCSLASFDLLLSVTPMYAAAGAGSAAAGLVTGMLLLGTVAAELAAPLLMRRCGYRPVLATGAVLLGIPALALLSGGPLVITVTVSVVRGLGFGLTGVATGALTAALLPVGVWLAGHYSYAVVVGMTAVSALVPLAVLPWLAGAAGRGKTGASADTRLSAGVRSALRQGRQLRPSLIFAASAVAGGVVVSFLPLAAGVSASIAVAGLLAQGLTATISRWWAGWYGDRHGHPRLLVPGLAIAAVGMGVLIWVAAPAAVIAAMCLFGTGFGITQNATLALMIDRMPASGIGTASALWNLAYDAGYGAGPVAFGLLVSHIGYPAGFALTAVLMLTALPAARQEYRWAR